MILNVRYSKKAERDLEEIAAFTFERWGDEQARIYIGELYKACRLIAEQPMIGRLSVPNRPTWIRLEHESHIILYSTARAGITVQRIIHKDRLLTSVVR